MSGFLFDTNTFLDIATADPIWLQWSEKQFRSADNQEMKTNTSRCVISAPSQRPLQPFRWGLRPSHSGQINYL